MLRKCIVCNKKLSSTFGNHPFDPPNGGTNFTSTGNFGSSVSDIMDGTIFEITVCDKCLKEKKSTIVTYKVIKRQEYKKVKNPL